MTRPSDSHWSLLTPAQKRKTRIILESLAAHKIRYVVGGGWAVYAHEASTPSVDCDVFMKGRLPQGLAARLSAEGIRIGPQQDLEILALDEPMGLWGTGEEDLGIAAVSYTPSKVFAGRVESRDLALDRIVKGVPVPDRLALAVTKLCALQGRSLAYRSFTDGEARMRLGPVATPQILSLGPSYYLRKAGKDLFDVSLLIRSAADVDGARELAGPSVWSVVRREVVVLPTAITEMGNDCARRVDKGTPDHLLALLLA